ncbi:SDR family oxidoreductase [Georgenia yuyongxinii]|uniref:SDR family oxidoreductase n=1 Tax=Georgenia yuyongxinii TaxID=2589797 RepID=UPI001C8F27F9|nr:SDR family oxidoreductase [Georgenia yuyongxinii]
MTDPVKASDLDWTIVRFVAPKHTPKQGNLRVGFFGIDKLGFAVGRAHIAAFTAAQADDDTYVGRAPPESESLDDVVESRPRAHRASAGRRAGTAAPYCQLLRKR